MSWDVAGDFEERHDHVTEAIKNLVLEMKDQDGICPPNFREANYTDEQSKPPPMYKMDRDGFTPLAMGFVGEKAPVE